MFLAFNVHRPPLSWGRSGAWCSWLAAQAGVPILLYPPLMVKKAVVGYGQASKVQVKMMVENLLGLTVDNEHAADALAVGVCHYFHSRWLGATA